MSICSCMVTAVTSCAGGRHNMPPPPASWPFDLESGFRVTCKVGYTSVPILVFLYRPLCSRLRPDVRDRQMSDAHNCSIPPIIGVRHNNRASYFCPASDKTWKSWRRSVAVRAVRLRWLEMCIYSRGHAAADQACRMNAFIPAARWDDAGWLPCRVSVPPVSPCSPRRRRRRRRCAIV